MRIAANLLAQCRIRIAVPESHRQFDTPRSRELAHVLALPKPTLYFTAGRRNGLLRPGVN